MRAPPSQQPQLLSPRRPSIRRTTRATAARNQAAVRRLPLGIRLRQRHAYGCRHARRDRRPDRRATQTANRNDAGGVVAAGSRDRSQASEAFPQYGWLCSSKGRGHVKMTHDDSRPAGVDVADTPRAPPRNSGRVLRRQFRRRARPAVDQAPLKRRAPADPSIQSLGSVHTR